MKSKTLIAVEWLWSNRGKDLWWTPAVLMAAAANPDQTAPKLTIVEANSVFRNLFEKGLIFQEVREGHLGFCLHESKIQEWQSFIEHLSVQNFPDKIASDDEKSHPQEQIATPDLKGFVKSKSFDDLDNFFKLIGAIGIACWPVHEWVIHNDKFFLFITVICFIADVFYIFIHKFLPHKRPLIVLGWLIYFVCIWLIYRNPYETNPVEAVNTTKILPPVETSPDGWLPPELPPGCSNVIIWFGGAGQIYPVSQLSQYPYGPIPESFPVSQATPEAKKSFAASPGFNRQIKNYLAQLVTTGTVNGLPENDSIIIPVIVSNRLFIYVKIPFLAEKQKIVMSDKMDSILTNCLPQADTNYWDWNYSSRTKTNVFEIVNHAKNPVLQVIYKSPNEIQVNGIIFGSKYDFTATYDGKMPVWFFGSKEPVQIVENQTTQTVTLAEAQNKMTNMILFLDAHAVYDGLSTNQSPIFKYPSNLYPGEFVK